MALRLLVAHSLSKICTFTVSCGSFWWLLRLRIRGSFFPNLAHISAFASHMAWLGFFSTSVSNSYTAACFEKRWSLSGIEPTSVELHQIRTFRTLYQLSYTDTALQGEGNGTEIQKIYLSYECSNTKARKYFTSKSPLSCTCISLYAEDCFFIVMIRKSCRIINAQNVEQFSWTVTCSTSYRHNLFLSEAMNFNTLIVNRKKYFQNFEKNGIGKRWQVWLGLQNKRPVKNFKWSPTNVGQLSKDIKMN